MIHLGHVNNHVDNHREGEDRVSWEAMTNNENTAIYSCKATLESISVRVSRLAYWLLWG